MKCYFSISITLLLRTPQVPSKYLRNYVIKKPNQMAVYVDLLAYLSIVITSQTKYSESPSQGSIWETCEIFEENRKKKEFTERSKVWIKGMIIRVITYWRKIEPLWCIFSKNAWVPCNAVKVAGVVEGVNGQCDMIHQDAGNFKTRSTISFNCREL